MERIRIRVLNHRAFQSFTRQLSGDSDADTRSAALPGVSNLGESLFSLYSGETEAQSTQLVRGQESGRMRAGGGRWQEALPLQDTLLSSSSLEAAPPGQETEEAVPASPHGGPACDAGEAPRAVPSLSHGGPISVAQLL